VPSAIVERVRSFYSPLLRRQYENPAPREQDIVHLEQLASGYGSLREFLDDLVLDPPTSTGDLAGPPVKDEDWLVLSTIHSAKGLEWDAVYLIHAADGCLPSDMSTGSREEIDEELRLAYVAMTRARDFLYVLWPLRFYARTPGVSDRHVFAQLSRFFNGSVLSSMDRRSGARAEAAVDSGMPQGAAGDIGGRIRDIWR